ncbi:hypothetical protein BKA69DRAFT_1089250 [Paraphysoderma sedebokerense]|nr:hypothetical protein BKA69DRAFT_1105298 [Paraphysoderma sedebokerense]KAI9138904.1 hypothetical protein BKA69DRAFT_1089250 [Paraphysoderma sedebokerense]
MRGNGDFTNGVKVADIASGVQPNAGSVTWSVPSSLTNSNDYFLQWQWVGQSPSTFKYSGAFPVTGGSGSSSLSLTATATSTSVASSSATSVMTATRTSTSEQTSTSTSGSPNRPTLDANVNSGAMGVNSGLLVGFVGTGVALVGGLGVVGLLV